MAVEYLDKTGLAYFWGKIKAYVDAHSGGGLTVNDIYPVGSIYMSVNAVDPNTLFSGTTWVQIKDTFLLAAGDTYANTATGGAATVTLTTNEIPAHTHGSKSLTGSARIQAESALSSVNMLNSVSGIVGRSTSSSGYYSTSGRTSINNQYDILSVDASHEHTSVGGGAAHNNMPPYLAVNVWKRTA